MTNSTQRDGSENDAWRRQTATLGFEELLRRQVRGTGKEPVRIQVARGGTLITPGLAPEVPVTDIFAAIHEERDALFEQQDLTLANMIRSYGGIVVEARTFLEEIQFGIQDITRVSAGELPLAVPDVRDFMQRLTEFFTRAPESFNLPHCRQCSEALFHSVQHLSLIARQFSNELSCEQPEVMREVLAIKSALEGLHIVLTNGLSFLQDELSGLMLRAQEVDADRARFGQKSLAAYNELFPITVSV